MTSGFGEAGDEASAALDRIVCAASSPRAALPSPVPTASAICTRLRSLMTMPDDRQQRVAPGAGRDHRPVGRSSPWRSSARSKSAASIRFGRHLGQRERTDDGRLHRLFRVAAGDQGRSSPISKSVHDARRVSFRLPDGARGGQAGCRREAGRLRRRTRGGACAYRAACGFDGGVRCGGGCRRRHPRRAISTAWSKWSSTSVHAPMPRGAGLGAITFSGGLRGMLLDAATAHGLEIPAARARDAQEARNAADGRHHHRQSAGCGVCRAHQPGRLSEMRRDPARRSRHRSAAAPGRAAARTRHRKARKPISQR